MWPDSKAVYPTGVTQYHCVLYTRCWVMHADISMFFFFQETEFLAVPQLWHSLLSFSKGNITRTLEIHVVIGQHEAAISVSEFHLVQTKWNLIRDGQCVCESANLALLCCSSVLFRGWTRSLVISHCSVSASYLYEWDCNEYTKNLLYEKYKLLPLKVFVKQQ